MKTAIAHITHLIQLFFRRTGAGLIALVMILFLLVLSGTVINAKERKSDLAKKEESNKKEEAEKKGESEKGTEKIDAESVKEAERRSSREESDLIQHGFDETSILADMQRLGSKEINTLLRNNIVYLSVTDIFDFLKIKNSFSPAMDSITGFFINQDAKYTIDAVHNIVFYNSKEWRLTPEDIVHTSQNVYLRIDRFNEIFGLECVFDAYNLSVKLNSNQEVPAVIEKKQEEVRNNLQTLKGTIKADTTIPRSYPAFHFGAADWFVYSEQRANETNSRANLSLGAVVLGGETNVGLNYYSNSSFDEKQQYYQWRYANNDNTLVKQVMLGKIASPTISSIFAPIVGAQFTNRPTTFRRSFGSYNISDITSPNWIVELYVNNVLVDYTKADASGFYSLDVPLVYGSSDVKLRFYGQYGEIQTKEQHIDIPVNFLPSKEVEYSVSSGLVEDSKSSMFSRSVVNYGVSRGMTVGGGLEYLSSVASGNYIPFVNTSLKLMSNMYFAGEYAYGVRGKGLINYRLPSNIQFELNYVKYTPGQTAVIYNYDEEKKASVAIPVRLKGFSGLTRLAVDEILLPNATKEWLGEWLISSGFGRASVNLTTYWTMIKREEVLDDNSSLNSNLAVSVRLPYGITITPQVQYDYSKSQFLSLKCSAEKMVAKHGFLNLAFERQPVSNITIGNVGFRYDFSFAKVSTTASRFNNQNQFAESASGSFIYDKKSNFHQPGNRTSVGRAAVAVLPFVDVNNNGHYDAGEPKVYGVKIAIGGGIISYRAEDTTFFVTDMEPYTSYLLQVNSDGVDNIGWQIKNRTVRVTPSPNNVTMIEVPFSIVGEISGTVSVKRSYLKKERGIGRILVDIYNKDSVLVASTMSEQDGYFSYTGLRPGSYYVCIDTAQLRNINYSSLTGAIPATIAQNIEGDLVDGIKFVIQPNFVEKAPPEELKATEEPAAQPALVKLPSYGILVDVVPELSIAGKLKTKLVRTFKLPVGIEIVRDDYLVEIVGFKTREEAENFIFRLTSHGYMECIVISLEK